MRKGWIFKVFARFYIALYATILFFALAELVIKTLFPSVLPSPRSFFTPFADKNAGDQHIRGFLVARYYLEDPDLFWRLNSETHPEGVTPEGFHADRIFGPKREGVFRILCIGDSCTFSFGKNGFKISYPEQLREILCERFPGNEIEVINAGVNGYSSLQGYRYLKKLFPKYNPDCVIISFGHNERVITYRQKLSLRS